MAAATASSRGIREKDERIEYLNLKASEVEISSLSVETNEETLG
jgi:hypothetical protein